MRRIFLPFILYFILCSLALSQVNVNVLVLNKGINTLIPADFDFEKVGASEEIFQITIERIEPAPILDCYLELEVTKDGQTLATTISKPFTIPGPRVPDPNPWTMTNVELINDMVYLEAGNDLTLIDMRKGEFDDDADEIQKEILSSGKVPIGFYRIIARIYQGTSTSGPIATGFDDFQITNPSYVQLVAPGQSFGSAFTSSVFTEFPVFQWNGNGAEYQVAVFEKKRMQESADDILNSRPNWESERINRFTEQYPQGDEAVPLEYGNTYYWAVKMFIQTSSGEEAVTSEIWTFKLENPANQGDVQSRFTKDEILSFLREYLGSQGEDIASKLFEYDLKSIRYNGEQIDISALYKELNKFRDKDIEIYDLNFSE
jgi:hypothetical protein